MGGKVLAAGYPFGEYDALVVFEAPDDTGAANLSTHRQDGAALDGYLLVDEVMHGKDDRLRRVDACLPEQRHQLLAERLELLR